MGVVGKFVEFFGPGVAQLSIADRATIANMCPEYGATAAFFPVDDVSIQYLAQTGGFWAAGKENLTDNTVLLQSWFPLFNNWLEIFTYMVYVIYIWFITGYHIQGLSLFLFAGRDPQKLAYITEYLKAVGMFRDYNNVSQDPDFTQVRFFLQIVQHMKAKMAQCTCWLEQS